LGVYDRVLRDGAGKTLYHYVLIDFLCKRVAGEPHGAGDAAEARWFTREEVAKLALPEDTAEVIRKGFERKEL
jgi:8-oxo-dGTP diphosphatase